MPHRYAGIFAATSGSALPTLPRVIVTSDLGQDPDDMQSWRRFLCYANQFRIVGLIATRTVGGTVNPSELTGSTAILSDYGDVVANLNTHGAGGYPSEAELVALVKSGHATGGTPGAGKETTGSNHILETVNDSNEPTWVLIWGQQFDTAQAIWNAQNGGGSITVANFNDWLAKLRIYAIADQQSGLSATIRSSWPTIYYIENGPAGTTWDDQQFRGMYQNDSQTDIPLVSSGLYDLVFTPWVQANVHGHGSLGDGYPTNVDQNPNTTNNHSSGEGGGIKEGDTPSWFYVLPNGLNNPDQPTWGGWGGRFALVSNNYYTDTDALDDSSELPTEHGNQNNTNCRRKWPIARWRQEYQNDFQARMDWCNNATFGNANHHPVAALNGIGGKSVAAISADGGTTVNLSAAGSTDPDGHALSYAWSHYRGVGGSYAGAISITGATSQSCSFTAPNANTTVHVILKVTDNGTPPLTSYRRAVVTVTAVAGAYSPNAVVLDGSDDLRSTALAGVADSELWTGALSFKVTAVGTTQRLIGGATASSSGSGRYSVTLQTDGRLEFFARNSGGNTRLQVFSSALSANTWYHVLWSFDLANAANRHVYINDVSDLATITTYGGATPAIDFTLASHAVGTLASSVGIERLTGELCDVWMDPGRYVDFSITANRRLFFSAANAVADKGSDGSVPFGTAPRVFLSSATASWHTNKGTGGGYTLTGTLGTSGSPPPGA